MIYVVSSIGYVNKNANSGFLFKTGNGLCCHFFPLFVEHILTKKLSTSRVLLGPVHTYADIIENGGFFFSVVMSAGKN